MAIVHRETGPPIYAHPSRPQKTGLAQLDLFEAAGVDPARVVIGHACEVHDHATFVDFGETRRSG
jgi:predicted metal-dependent phosphotriesterase family hydrolase